MHLSLLNFLLVTKAIYEVCADIVTTTQTMVGAMPITLTVIVISLLTV